MHIFVYTCLFQMLLNVKESFVYSQGQVGFFLFVFGFYYMFSHIAHPFQLSCLSPYGVRPSIFFPLGLSTIPLLPTWDSQSRSQPRTAPALPCRNVQLSPSHADQELPPDLPDPWSGSHTGGDVVTLPGRAGQLHLGSTGTQCHLEGRVSSLPAGIPVIPAGLPSPMVTMLVHLCDSWGFLFLFWVVCTQTRPRLGNNLGEGLRW